MGFDVAPLRITVSTNVGSDVSLCDGAVLGNDVGDNVVENVVGDHVGSDLEEVTGGSFLGVYRLQLGSMQKSVLVMDSPEQPGILYRHGGLS